MAILDSTVKVFHDDSLKFFLSLYGHKLPVMSMDVSDDGTLLATGSADKTVKVWGLDFGDCHRSLLAHDDSIMVRLGFGSFLDAAPVYCYCIVYSISQECPNRPIFTCTSSLRPLSCMHCTSPQKISP